MALRPQAVAASAFALCLALSLAGPARANDQIELPALPDAADVVITAADIGAVPDVSALLPPPPEPAQVVLTMPSSTEADIAAAEKLPAKEPVTEAVVVTAAITPASPLPDVSMPDIDIALALPAAPEAAPVSLDGLLPPPSVAVPPPAEATTVAGQAADLSQLIASSLPDALGLPWLPERDAREIVAAYAARGHQPFWMSEDGLNRSGGLLTRQLARAGEDGLRASDYALPRMIVPRAVDLALADIRLTALAVRYARDARGARVDIRRISSLITPQLSIPGAAEVLGHLIADGADPAQVLGSYQPRHEGYQALRRKLAEARAQRGVVDPANVPQVRIPAGPAIRMGMRDDRIVLIRARFGFAPDDTRQHDRSLATVVAGFQRENGLPANGVLNRATIDAINGGATSALEADLIANMERWRWLPVSLGDEHLIVNVPEYLVRKVEDGRVVHNARVVVGKVERPTPIFSDMMDHLVINPSWTIPPTILKQDILPKLATDPGYAERRGFEVIRRGNQITLRQPPGPTNALGNVKFMFPNDHAVYLHDTPARGLFASSRRAFSSGCVRVEQPLKLAELVLGGSGNGWSERRLQGMIGSGERTIRLTRKLPIHIVYMTQVVGTDGGLRSLEDIYGFHRRTREALGL